MGQVVQRIQGLPEAPIDAAAAFFARHHGETLALIEQAGTTSLVIVLDHAAYDHDAWRRALAGDLARRFAPKRCNVVGASDPEAMKKCLTYLEGAHGVTGQYLAAHE